MHDSASQDHASQDQMNNGFLTGLLWGAAVGAALGLLLAPKRGSELRHQLSDSAGRVKDKVSEAYDEATHTMNDVMSRSRRAFDAGRNAYQSARPEGAPSSTRANVDTMPNV